MIFVARCQRACGWAKMKKFMKLGRCLLVAALLLAGSCGSVFAEDWMFDRSYYSHRDSPGYALGVAPEPLSAYRRPYRHPRAHGYIRGGFRINNVRIWNGWNYDTEYQREIWYDAE